jgi:hypothetical protein
MEWLDGDLAQKGWAGTTPWSARVPAMPALEGHSRGSMPYLAASTLMRSFGDSPNISGA